MRESSSDGHIQSSAEDFIILLLMNFLDEVHVQIDAHRRRNSADQLK